MSIFHDEREKYIFFSAVITIGVGILFYHFVEWLSIVDATYFSIVTLTTVWYGDIAPTTDVGKIFTSFYILIWIGFIGVFINEMSQIRVKKNTKKKNEKKS